MQYLHSFKNMVNSLRSMEKQTYRRNLFILILSLMSFDTFADPGFSTSPSAGAQIPNWMSHIPDYTLISQMSLPGTHDTMSYQAGMNPLGFVLVQSMDLQTQLNAGIRVVDIRARHIGDSFAMHHGSFFLNAFFGDDVMQVINQFLQNNPSETIFMRLTNEYNEQDNTRSFADTFNAYMVNYGQRVYRGTSLNPRLSDVRGKVVIMDNFPGESDYAKINYSDANIQDEFELVNKEDAGTKWNKVLAHLNNTNLGDTSRIHINYLSAYRGTTHTEACWSFPFVCTYLPIAPSGIASTVNENAKNHLAAHTGSYFRVGMIMADFPGHGLISEVIASNFHRYQAYSMHTGTAFAEAQNNIDFAVMPNGDLMSIVKWTTGTGTTEVHIATAASNYSQFSLHTGTALAEFSSLDSVKFVVMPNRDLMLILSANTGSGMTEVHILTAASNYAQFRIQTGIPLPLLGDNADFVVMSNNDLMMIQKNSTGTHSTEVHILSASSNYSQFVNQTGTSLPEVGDEADFAMMPNNDLMMIKKWNTGTNSTEIHILSAASNYTQFTLELGIPLIERTTGQSFGVLPNGDLMQILKENTGTHTTEVHILAH